MMKWEVVSTFRADKNHTRACLRIFETLDCLKSLGEFIIIGQVEGKIHKYSLVIMTNKRSYMIAL